MFGAVRRSPTMGRATTDLTTHREGRMKMYRQPFNRRVACWAAFAVSAFGTTAQAQREATPPENPEVAPAAPAPPVAAPEPAPPPPPPEAPPPPPAEAAPLPPPVEPMAEPVAAAAEPAEADPEPEVSTRSISYGAGLRVEYSLDPDVGGDVGHAIASNIRPNSGPAPKLGASSRHRSRRLDRHHRPSPRRALRRATSSSPGSPGTALPGTDRRTRTRTWPVSTCAPTCPSSWPCWWFKCSCGRS
jgi:outer membrane biosynthesis protein TonB